MQRRSEGNHERFKFKPLFLAQSCQGKNRRLKTHFQEASLVEMGVLISLQMSIVAKSFESKQLRHRRFMVQSGVPVLFSYT